MAYDPEAIQAAIFDRLSSFLKGAGLLKNSTRRDMTFADFSIDQQPAMTCVKYSAAGHRDPSVPTLWTIEVMVTFFLRQPTDKAQTVETAAHEMLVAVDAALSRQPDEFNDDDNESTTLGGLVSSCYREDEEFGRPLGSGDDQAAVTTKIRILANP